MESEKVKEIKKCLDNCKGRHCRLCPRFSLEPKQEEDCRLALIEESLTLINELEKENRNKADIIIALLKAQKFYETEKLKKFSEELKDEIGEMKQFFRSCLDRDYCGLTEDQIDEKLKEVLGEKPIYERIVSAPDTCVYCGQIVPEGTQVCINCENEILER